MFKLIIFKNNNQLPTAKQKKNKLRKLIPSFRSQYTYIAFKLIIHYKHKFSK